MESKLPICEHLKHQKGARQMNKVLHVLFDREREDNIGDDIYYGKMIQEIQIRVQHRHAIILELQNLGYHRAFFEPLDSLMLAERDDLDEIDFLIERRKTCIRRAAEQSKIMKMLRNYI
ncbi:hypothetical protein CTI12_AA569600 [Artemisia annua]|uniref:Uncharacterized protein n=1 Tax=Artemisia annua TaxID=35608 RepID=A0A2U1KSG8_ARTAN|nr:hypothetical protein CTI12_AA569600 [Artemisia annua]